MSIKQVKLTVNAHKHNKLNSFCNNEHFYVKRHENRKSNKNQKRDREFSNASNCLVGLLSHVKATRLGNKILDSLKY